jgi:hypothetical protein
MKTRPRSRTQTLLAGQIVLREIAPLFLIIALCLSLACGIYLNNQDTERDLEGVVARRGAGTVTTVTTFVGGKSQEAETRPALVALDGRPVRLNLADPTWANWLYVGQKVHFTYRVGHSGNWYIDQIAPASQPAPVELRDRR